MTDTLSEALKISVQTDPGMVREHNEDAVFASSSLGLAILADGMGGYNAGEVASSMATTLLSAELEKSFASRRNLGVEKTTGRTFARRCLLEKIALANRAIFDAARREQQYAGMGTTLVVAHFHDNRVTVAHIGDSRFYRLREGELKALTRDHSLLQEQIDCGLLTEEEARFSTRKNLVTRALGVDPRVETEINEHVVQPGDIYLLCSDGLNDMVPHEDIREILLASEADIDTSAAQLVWAANDNGGRDNVSVILVKVLCPYPASGDWWSRFTERFK